MLDNKNGNAQKKFVGVEMMRSMVTKLPMRSFGLDIFGVCPLKGGHPDLFVKLDFGIAVDQQNRARDRNFEGVPNPACSLIPA